MVNTILSNTVKILEDAGIVTRRGMPAGKMGTIHTPVAAVQLQAADMRQKTVMVRVRILSPAHLGAAACEEVALTAGAALRTAGGKCSVDLCQCDTGSGLFYTDIHGQFAEAVPKITINETVRGHVVSFTAWRELDSSSEELEALPWNFRLEEFFPMDEKEEEDPDGAFMLTHTCENGTETYTEAIWTSHRRQWDASGLRVIRQGVAQWMETG